MKHLTKFETLEQAQGLVLDDTNTPHISLIEELRNTTMGGLTFTNYIPCDYSKKYFTFIARQNCTMNFDLLFEDEDPENNVSCGTISYSLNNGETWSEEYGEIELNLNAGEKVLLKGHMNVYDGGYDQVTDIEGGWIVSTGYFDVEGNIMSLFYGDDFEKQSTITEKTTLAAFFKGNTYLVNAKNLILPSEISCEYGLSSMFEDCTSLTTAPAILPATTLSKWCYVRMFFNCTGLTTAPELPATTLASNCYSSMFNGCTALTTAPELPATTLTHAYNCYEHMFSDCTSLTTAPELPATTLTDSCYEYMFSGCTSLTTAPELPAYALPDACYYGMFTNCKSLTIAPELLESVIGYQSYSYMFDGCTSLNYIKCLAEYGMGDNTEHWVRNVAASGTFVGDYSTEWYIGDNGLPSGWTYIPEGEPDSGDEGSSSSSSSSSL